MADEFVPRSAQVPESEWMKEHKGEYLRTIAQVWYCEDEVCGCYSAEVYDVFVNLVMPRGVVFKNVWEGEFYTDHEERKADNDLIRYRQQLKKSDPELEARIIWQGGVEYDRDLSLEDDASVWDKTGTARGPA